MSGLVKLVKKSWNRLKQNTKKILKSKIFKVVVIAAAIIFTGGAALGALGAAGAGGGFMATMGAAFQGGLSALGSVGSAMWTGVKAAGTAIKGFFVGAGGTTAGGVGSTATSTGIANTAQGASMNFLQGAATETAKAGMLGNPLVQAAAVTTGGNMVSGYAQGRAQEEQNNQMEKQRKSRDQYGYDGYGRKTGDLVDPTERLAEMTRSQDPSLRQGMPVTLDNAPVAPTVEAPSLATTMRDKLLLSLNGLTQGVA